MNLRPLRPERRWAPAKSAQNWENPLGPQAIRATAKKCVSRASGSIEPDGNGSVVIGKKKRGLVPRDAAAQLIDYAAYRGRVGLAGL